MKIFVCEDVAGFDWQRFLPLMPQERQERAMRFRFEADKKLCVASYMLLCRALNETHGISGQLRFTYGEHGKPYLADYPQVFFNISHCRSRVVCAVSDCEVGVDIQPIQPYSDAVTRRVLCSNELVQLDAAENKELEFARLWTRKEAYLKMLGTGISDDMSLCDMTSVNELYTFAQNNYALSVYEKRSELQSAQLQIIEGCGLYCEF